MDATSLGRMKEEADAARHASEKEQIIAFFAIVPLFLVTMVLYREDVWNFGLTSCVAAVLICGGITLFVARGLPALHREKATAVAYARAQEAPRP